MLPSLAAARRRHGDAAWQTQPAPRFARKLHVDDAADRRGLEFDQRASCCIRRGQQRATNESCGKVKIRALGEKTQQPSNYYLCFLLQVWPLKGIPAYIKQVLVV